MLCDLNNRTLNKLEDFFLLVQSYACGWAAIDVHRLGKDTIRRKKKIIIIKILDGKLQIWFINWFPVEEYYGNKASSREEDLTSRIVEEWQE